VNKQGQTRLAKYFTEFLTTDERRVLEGEVVRRCLSRTDKQVRPCSTAHWPVAANLAFHFFKA
jgi:hypothetical protein